MKKGQERKTGKKTKGKISHEKRQGKKRIKNKGTKDNYNYNYSY